MKILYIDAQNTHQATAKLWRHIDRGKLFDYLKNKHQIDMIIYAVWFIKENQNLYKELSTIGYTLLFKETIRLPNWSIKWNVDIDIAIQSIFDLCSGRLTCWLLMTNDWDYNTLLKTFKEHNKLWKLFTPDVSTASRLITKLSPDLIDLQRIKHLIQKQKSS
jgi:uncharacterized LabA/DUF88 family protein